MSLLWLNLKIVRLSVRLWVARPGSQARVTHRVLRESLWAYNLQLGTALMLKVIGWQGRVTQVTGWQGNRVARPRVPHLSQQEFEVLKEHELMAYFTPIHVQVEINVMVLDNQGDSPVDCDDLWDLNFFAAPLLSYERIPKLIPQSIPTTLATPTTTV